jgi:hypothetical protein
MFAALLLSSLVASLPPVDPCALATSAEVEEVLGGPTVDLTPDEIGEETAPYCQWATATRDVRIKVELWSPAELPVLGLSDAETYYGKLDRESVSQSAYLPLDGMGEQAFEAADVPATGFARDARIVVLKGGRVVVFDFTHVPAEQARAFAAAAIGRM